MAADALQAQGYVQQRTPSTFGDGAVVTARLSSKRQLYVADWKTELLLAGRCFVATVGGISAGGDVALITGGGNGTTIDTDQPELIVGVDAGHYMIPLEFRCSAQVDLDADAEVGNILLFADATQAPPASVTGTVETPQAMLDSGNHSSVARAFSAITADITDPVDTVVLDYKTVRAADAGAAASEQIVRLDMLYKPDAPILLRGPCSVVACWGGTAAVTAIASLVWAEVPIGAFE